MYIPIIDEQNIHDDSFIGAYKSKYLNAEDIITRKRSIMVHGDFDFKRSQYEGVHSIKCTIVNLAQLDGRYHMDSSYNPETVLVKTVYNGYLLVPIEAIKSDDLKITQSMISKSKFKVLNAYTSCMGLWSVYSDYDNFSSIGVSVMDMKDLKFATINSKNTISFYGAPVAAKVEVTFDGNIFSVVLPLPYPQYYSRMQSEINGDNPVMTNGSLIPVDNICDDTTKVSVVNFDRRVPKVENKDYRFEGDSNSELMFLNPKGERVTAGINGQPMHIRFGLVRSMIDELYGKLFKIFNRYQLRSFDFMYDSIGNRIVVPSMLFSYDFIPKDFTITVIHEFIDDVEVIKALSDFSNYYGDCLIVGRITDLKCDISITFVDKQRDVNDVKMIRYSTSIFDIFNSLTSFETSVKTPITMI